MPCGPVALLLSSCKYPCGPRTYARNKCCAINGLQDLPWCSSCKDESKSETYIATGCSQPTRRSSKSPVFWSILMELYPAFGIPLLSHNVYV
jgi:hypothetical protein